MPADPHTPRRARNIDGFRISQSSSPRRLSPFGLHSSAANGRLSAQPGRRVAARAVGLPQSSGVHAVPPRRTASSRSAISAPPTLSPASSAPASPLPKTTFSYAPRHGAASGRPPKKNRRFGFSRLRNMTWKKGLLVGGSLVLILGVSIGGWLGWKVYRNVAKLTHDNNPFSLLQVFHPVPLKNQDGRVNVLIAGDSADRVNAQANGGDLTDSIMVLSIDTHNDTAFMLSIPRDLWVPMPTGNSSLGTHQKINAAHEVTSFNQSGYPSGGVGALESVINENMGITVDYYALVNYTAFQDLVNALGGIAVNIQSSDPRGLYDPQPYPGSKSFKLPNGTQTLNGIEALDLARARGEGYGAYGFPQSDFTRTEHQRQMVLAIKDKASSAGVIANPFKVGALLDAVGNNVTTDLKLDEIETLYSLVKKVNDANIASENINTLNGPNTALLASYTSPNGESALIPAAGIDNFAAIKKAVTKLFTDDPVAKESATVVVLNGGTINGLAKAEGAILTAKGMNVATMASAPAAQSGQASNQIIDNSGGNDPATKAVLESLFGTNVVTSTSLTRAYPGANFIVVLGTSQQMPATSSTGSTTSTSSGSTN